MKTLHLLKQLDRTLLKYVILKTCDLHRLGNFAETWKVVILETCLQFADLQRLQICCRLDALKTGTWMH